MARDVIERELTGTRPGRIAFALAGEGDDADIRRLLQENPMPGNISLSLEREPDYFADAYLPGETKQTIVAHAAGRVVCTGSCTIRRRFVNGEPCQVGYLGGLRLDAGQAGRFDILRRGYEFFHELQASEPADFYFTSIAADNERARTLLERGLPGMPRYEFIGEFVTVLLSTDRRHAVSKPDASPVPPMEQVIELLNNHNCQQQFAPCWSEDELGALQMLGLRVGDFQFIRDAGHIVAGAVLWDQRKFKQTLIRGYAKPLARARPLLNLVARFTDGARLPAIGETLANAFITQLAVDPDKPDSLTGLVKDLRGAAARRGIELITLGFAANDPRLAVVQKKFRGREYRSRLYSVRWPDCGGAAAELDGRILAPEVAWL
ncbi:MAG TPA: hypothetical protein VK815_16385 [Candidatus Acidoferrales bacterium]|jgi:hypothetical protein|nr:hypothetical protein [Candidatus Acidoferrales bacterium]